MDFSLGEEQKLLRDTVRAFLAKEVDLDRVLKASATASDVGYERLWVQQIELGWPGLIIPQAYGGLDMSLLDLAVVIGECGRFLAPSPFFGTLAGTWAVLAAGLEEQKKNLLPGVAKGARKLALSMTDAAGDCAGSRDLPDATPTGGSHVLSGLCPYVVDAGCADTAIVLASRGGEQHFYVVQLDQECVRIRLLDWRDITRQVGAIELDGASATQLAVPADVAWPFIRDRLYLTLAAESAAGLQKTLEDTTAYAKQRVTFGRPIGAYQAIKHSLADMLGQAECATTAVLYAAWALMENRDDAAIAAACAQAFASESYRDATHRSIQIFGAVGFTWEMKNHLYYKRARANAVLLGPPEQQREEIVKMLISRRARHA